MTVTANYAAEKLRKLAKEHRIVPFQMGDEEQVCGHDLLPLEWVGGNPRGHWVHSPDAIKQLRAATYDERWPNGADA